MLNYKVVNRGNNTVTISEDWFDELFNDSLFLNSLRNNGVDNWDGYGEAWREYNSCNEEGDE